MLVTFRVQTGANPPRADLNPTTKMKEIMMQDQKSPMLSSEHSPNENYGEKDIQHLVEHAFSNHQFLK